MPNFKDEFDDFNAPVKTEVPIEYKKLEDSILRKRDLDTFSDYAQEVAINKYKILTMVDNELTAGWTQKNLDPILDKLFENNKEERPNWRTLARWRKKYLEKNSDIAALAPESYKKGNRTKRIQGDEKFFELALKRFLDSKRPKISVAFQYYKDIINVENEHIVEGKIPIISYNSFNKRIKSLPPYPIAVARYGKNIADQWFMYCSKHKPPTRILERVEIDHTPLDLILLDDKLMIPIGRPYLTLLLDVFSGCVLGFHLSYKSPSYVSAAKAITHAIKPKELDALGITLQNDWSCYGKIENLVVDNGAEFWSHSLEHACRSSGINIQFNPVRKPWLKPFVERFFGQINQLFIPEMPGKTFSNILEKGDYKPEKDAVMRFSTFVEEFHRWIVDVYHHESDSREQRIPIRQWQVGFDLYPPLNMSIEDEERFSVLMFVSYKRTLSRNGIKFEEIYYDSTALSDYRKNYPQTKESRLKLIKVDPDDISKIYVFLDELDGYLEVPCTDTSGYTTGLSIHSHKTIKKINREITRESKDVLGLAKARLAIHERVEEEQKLLMEHKSKAKISSVKKQAQFADVSNTGAGTIQIQDAFTKNSTSEDSNDMFDDWEEELEPF